MRPQVTPEQATASGVNIVGVGARTPLGTCAASSAAAVRAGISVGGRHPHVIDSAGEPITVSRITYLPENLDGTARHLAMARPALAQALAPIGHLDGIQVPVIVGLPSTRPGLPTSFEDDLRGGLAAGWDAADRIGEVSVITAGHAAGLMAMDAGMARIRDGKCEFCAIGGVDSYLEPETLEWLDANGQIHSAGDPRNPRGFMPGEAAGFCLLASDQAVERHRLEAMSAILSVATAREKNLIKTESVCVGAGLTEAWRQALKSIPNGVRSDRLICDQNGEVYRADEFGFTVVRTSDRLADGGAFLAPAQFWGDVGAASGPLFAILAIAAGNRGYAKGPHTLLCTSSEGGERAAAILRTEIRHRER